MRAKGPICAVIASLVLAGCGSSPPSRFYTLASVPAPSPPHELKSASLVIGKLTVPSILDRPEIATRVSATRVEFSQTRRWAAPLDKLVRQTLADDLSAASPAAGAMPLVVDIDIGEFDADAAGEVTLDARWALRPQSRAALALGAEHAHLRLPPKADDVAATMSQALAMLAGRIVAGLPLATRR